MQGVVMSLLLIYNMVAMELYNYPVLLKIQYGNLAVIASGDSGIWNHLITSSRDCFTSNMSVQAANTIPRIVSNMLCVVSWTSQPPSYNWGRVAEQIHESCRDHGWGCWPCQPCHLYTWNADVDSYYFNIWTKPGGAHTVCGSKVCLISFPLQCRQSSQE